MAGEHLLLLLRARVADRQLEQEAVELRLGQRVGALVLDRVLGGDDDERVGQRVGRRPRRVTCRSSIDSSSAAWVFGGVRLISSASSTLVNTGPGRKRNPPPPVGAAVEDELAGHVGRHEVGRELHALEVEVEGGGERLDDQRLGHAGHALEQHVAAGQQRRDQAGQRAVLADDDLAHLVAHREDGGARVAASGAASTPAAGRGPGARRSVGGRGRAARSGGAGRRAGRARRQTWARTSSRMRSIVAARSASSGVVGDGRPAERGAQVGCVGRPVRSAATAASTSAGASGGRPRWSARKRRRSCRSRSAAWPGERLRSSRVPTAATSSDPAMGDGRRLGHRPAEAPANATPRRATKAMPSCRTARHTPAGISSRSERRAGRGAGERPGLEHEQPGAVLRGHEGGHDRRVLALGERGVDHHPGAADGDDGAVAPVGGDDVGVAAAVVDARRRAEAGGEQHPAVAGLDAGRVDAVERVDVAGVGHPRARGARSSTVSNSPVTGGASSESGSVTTSMPPASTQSSTASRWSSSSRSRNRTMTSGASSAPRSGRRSLDRDLGAQLVGQGDHGAGPEPLVGRR